MNFVKNKKAISELITTVFLILLVIAAVLIIAGFIFPFVSNSLKGLLEVDFNQNKSLSDEKEWIKVVLYENDEARETSSCGVEQELDSFTIPVGNLEEVGDVLNLTYIISASFAETPSIYRIEFGGEDIYSGNKEFVSVYLQITKTGDDEQKVLLEEVSGGVSVEDLFDIVVDDGSAIDVKLFGKQSFQERIQYCDSNEPVSLRYNSIASIKYR